MVKRMVNFVLWKESEGRDIGDVWILRLVQNDK